VTVYRKKPVEVEAVQYDGKNAQAIRAWMYPYVQQAGNPSVWFLTKNMAGTQAWNYVRDPAWGQDFNAAVYDMLHETWVGVKPGQWIIKGVKGEFYPCDPETFAETYEEA